MKRLLLLDTKDYTDDMPVFEKHSVRAIIVKNDRVAMQQSRDGIFKILGGVVEDGETHEETLAREVEEESGLIVKCDTIQLLGYIEERRRDVFAPDKIYICYTYFYSCEVEDYEVSLKLTASEIAKGYRLAWATPEQIVQTNTALIRDKWKMRDTEFIKMLAEGRFNDQ
jgi:8-oxo-dGTP pyrophosphatase MutT (NUDIX family)